MRFNLFFSLSISTIFKLIPATQPHILNVSVVIRIPYFRLIINSMSRKRRSNICFAEWKDIKNSILFTKIKTKHKFILFIQYIKINNNTILLLFCIVCVIAKSLYKKKTIISSQYYWEPKINSVSSSVIIKT